MLSCYLCKQPCGIQCCFRPTPKVVLTCFCSSSSILKRLHLYYFCYFPLFSSSHSHFLVSVNICFKKAYQMIILWNVLHLTSHQKFKLTRLTRNSNSNSLEIQTKSTRYYHTPIRVAKMEKDQQYHVLMKT